MKMKHMLLQENNIQRKTKLIFVKIGINVHRIFSMLGISKLKKKKKQPIKTQRDRTGIKALALNAGLSPCVCSDKSHQE